MENFKSNNQQEVKKLTRSELKNIVGGGYDMTVYNNCMSGWDSSTHTQQETNRKITACDAMATT